MKDFSFGCRRLLPKNVERIRVPLNYVDIIEKNIYNIDSKICGIIDDYKILHDSQKVADYVIQFLRTYLETIAARIYAYENPDKPTPIRGKDKWYTQYIKALKETNEYGYIWMFHHSLQIVTSHYVPAEDGAVRFMEGHINLLYQLRNHMREMFGLNLMENLEDYPQERNEELNPYYRKIYNSLREIQVEESAEHTKDRYYIMRKKYRFVDGRGFFEYTLAYAQEEITKFDRFVVYSFSDIPDNYSIQCDFAHTSVDFNGIDIDIKCLVAWTVSIRPCELEKIAAIAGYEVTVRSYNTFYRAMMKFLSKKGMNLLDILLADENDYDIYSEQVQIGQTSKFAEVFNKLRDIIINDKSGCNIIRYLISFLRNDVIRDQLADCPNNRLSYLYLKNEAIPFDEMPYASSLYKHNVTTSRLHRCLDIDDCEAEYRVELTNYHSDFGDEHRPPSFKWDAEIHYSQGKDKARVYTPDLLLNEIDENLQLAIKEFICQKCRNLPSYNDFQVRYCMTTTERKEANVMGPYELLDEVKAFIVRTIPEQQFENRICLNEVPHSLPLAIAVGYIILNQITHEMGGK